MKKFFLSWFIFEVVLHSLFIYNYSFWDDFLFVFGSGVLGLFLLVLLGRNTISDLQVKLRSNQVPGSIIIHRTLLMIGAFFIFLPGVATDIFGVLLILPGLRHLVIWLGAGWLAKFVASGAYHHIRFNQFGGGFYYRSTANVPPDGFSRTEPRTELRDVTPKKIEG